MGLRAARGARARAVCSKGPVQVFLAEGMFEIPPCQRKSFWKDRCFSWRSHGSLGANLVIIVLHDSQPWVSSHMNFPWQFPYFFTTKEFHPSVTHFASPFWWRSFRRFCPLVICTATASRFERGAKHVAQRWGIEADGFVGKCMTKTFKPHQEMCKTNLFQSVFFNKMFFLFVVCFFCGCQKKIPTWNAISQEQEYQQKMFWSRILLRHAFPFQRIPPQIQCVDLVEWHRKLVMKNLAMKDFTLGVLPWELTCLLKINGWKMHSLLK